MAHARCDDCDHPFTSLDRERNDHECMIRGDDTNETQRCDACWDRVNEDAYENQVERFYGSSNAVTDLERQHEILRLKR